MRNIKKTVILLFFLISIASILFNSCRKFREFDPEEFVSNEFYELDTANISDSMWVNGSFAAPILNTKLMLSTFIPKTDSTLWIEVDNDDLIHLRSYFKNLLVVTGSQIFNGFPANSGTMIPGATFVFKTDTSQLKVYDQALSGHLFFNDPKITFKFTNQIPIVTFFRLDTITFHHISGDPNAVTHTGHTDYPILAPTVLGTNAKSDIVIDKTVIPQLPEVFSPIPKFISFQVTVGSLINQILPFSVTGSETISMDVDIDLPLDARLVDFTMGDTIPFEMISDTMNQVTSAELRLEIENGFPFDAITQLTFTDSLNTFEEHLFEQPGWVLKAGAINSSGIVSVPTISRLSVILTQEQLQRLRDNNVTKIVYKSNLNTVNSSLGQFIRIYSYYQLGVKIGIKADYNFNLFDPTISGQ
jgi:hypothetical protein